MLGLHCCARASLQCGKRGPPFFVVRGLLIVVRRLLIVVRGLLIVVASLLLQSTGSRRTGFSSCGAWAQQLWLAGSRAQAQQLWHMGLAAPRHVGSSRTRDRTRVSRIGRRILNHCATREVPYFHFKEKKEKPNIN